MLKRWTVDQMNTPAYNTKKTQKERNLTSVELILKEKVHNKATV